MTQNSNNKVMQAQIVAQWITSLALSVICCAILFIVFAGYIVDLHESQNLLTVRLEVLMERHNQLQSELLALKRSPLVQINGVTTSQSPILVDPSATQAQQPSEVQQPAGQATPAQGDAAQRSSDPTAANSPDSDAKDDLLMPVLNPDQIGNEIAKPKESEKTKQPKKAQ